MIEKPGKGRLLITLLTVSLAVALSMNGLAFADDDDSRPGSLTVQRAEWAAGNHELVVEGMGPSRTVITISNAGTNERLGATRSDRRGRWVFQGRLSSAPCRIRAAAGRQSVEADVTGAPSNCGASQPPEVTLTGISISGPAEIPVGSGAQYTCTASYSDNSSQDVTSSADWSVDSGSASINGGYLTAPSVSSDPEVVVSARFQEKSATFTVTIKNAPISKVLSGLSINGPTTVNENRTATYTATAAYSDGTNAEVSALWSADSPFAAISAGGVLSASEVTADTVVALSTSYTENGITRTATQTVTILDTDGTLTGSHAGRFSTYEGTVTCLKCHTAQAREVHASVHYQWKGDASETLGLTPGDAGKLGGINDFCIYPDINWIGKLTNTSGQQVDGGCAKCHVGLGAKPEADPTQAQLENIDCLICHSREYKRKVGSVDGNFRFVPDTDNMAVGILQAASDITLPGKDICLNCHTKAGGGNNFKRGDIEEAHRNPDRSIDVHMASAAAGGAGLECLDCHVASGHKIAGRGSDLRPRESAVKVACTNCHSPSPHGSQDINKHTARVNCTVCHIPHFAKAAATDMDRDWSRPGVLVSATGLYEPYHVKQTNVIPEYRFFNGKSYFYQFGDQAVPEADGFVTMSEPDGKITDSGTKIYAFKRHQGNQPQDPVTGRLLPLKIGEFFQTGQIDTAVEQGAAGVGWKYNGYEFAKTERYMGLFHEVAPKENALTCNDCHNGGNRLDFAALGYTPLSTRNGKALCASCHERESASFTSIHSRHVTQYGYDCSTCHNFSKAK